MGLTFDTKLLASNGEDLQLLLPGFGRPSATYQKASFEHKISQFHIHISLWLLPRLIVVKRQPLVFQELCSIVKHELSTKLTMKERKDIADLHRKTFNEQAPSNMYRTRKDAFDPHEHPNWFFVKKKGLWVLEAGR